jgi:hypothetical protein
MAAKSLLLTEERTSFLFFLFFFVTQSMSPVVPSSSFPSASPSSAKVGFATLTFSRSVEVMNFLQF